MSSVQRLTLRVERNRIQVFVPGTRGFRGPPGPVSEAPVQSVAGRIGDVVLTKADVGLDNVDNTPDSSKPVSTAQAAADSAVAAAAAADATSKANAAQAAAIAAAAADATTKSADARTEAEATASLALAAHEAAQDPHPGYTTAAELVAGLSGKADALHTHSPGQLTQGGAAVGEALLWNGSEWVPGDLLGLNPPSNNVLRMWTLSFAFSITSASRDSDGLITTASVLWPDGSAGTFTRTAKNATLITIDAYTVTHTASGKTATQPAVTRDASGNVTAQPAITIA